jgi:aryl-alcohol dehydrogenase-like predicted oxidoreductase
MSNSKLVFGTGGRFGRLSPRLAQALVDTAIQLGVTKFDTGLFYCRGKSQQLLFSCLSKYISQSPSSLEISTKFPPISNYKVASNWLDVSISQLAFRDYIDTLFVWGPSLADLYDLDLVSILLSFKASGRIKAIGVNTHDENIMNQLITSPLGTSIDCVMIDFNLLQQDRAKIFPFFAEAGISVWAGTALCQGFLFQSLFQMVIRTRSFSYLMRALFNKPTKILLSKASKVRSVLARRYPASYESLPLSYVLSHEHVSRVPIGMLSRSSIRKNIIIESYPVDRLLLEEAAHIVEQKLNCT